MGITRQEIIAELVDNYIQSVFDLPLKKLKSLYKNRKRRKEKK